MIVKTVGRDKDNNIVVNDEKVSRMHLQMVQDDNGNISVVDVGSSNGTYVNGARIAGETRLKVGDEVRIGNTVLPWQDYFNVTQSQARASVKLSPTQTHSMQAESPKPKLRLYVAVGVFVLLLVAGVVWLCLRNNQNQDDLRKKDEYAKLVQKAREAENEALEAAAEYESAQRKADSTRLTEDWRVADSLRVVAVRTRGALDIINKELNSMIIEMNDTIKYQKDKIAAEQKMTAAADSAKKIAIEGMDEANRELEKEKGNVVIANSKAELTREFYKQLNNAKKGRKLRDVCAALEIKNAKNDDDREDHICKKFNTAYDANDITTLGNIIEAIKKALNEASNEQTKIEPTKTDPSRESQKTSDDIDDVSKYDTPLGNWKY